MSPLIQEKLLDLLVNITAIILGGGFITLIIEWRRHQREKLAWQREDALLQIDIPRAEIWASKWQITETTSDKDKLTIYENNLLGTVKQIVVVAQFVIRNTTASEIIITNYDAEVLQIPFGDNNKRFYDLETFDLVSANDIGAIRLRPFATVPRLLVFVSQFNKDRRLETIPTILSITVKTSNGKTIQGKENLKLLSKFSELSDLEIYNGAIHPRRYVDKIRKPEDDIPF